MGNRADGATEHGGNSRGRHKRTWDATGESNHRLRAPYTRSPQGGRSWFYTSTRTIIL